MCERSSKAEVAWQHATRATLQGAYYMESVEPAGYRELCDEGLLLEADRQGIDRYRFYLSPLGRRTYEYEGAVSGSLSAGETIRHILVRLGPPVA